MYLLKAPHLSTETHNCSNHIASERSRCTQIWPKQVERARKVRTRAQTQAGAHRLAQFPRPVSQNMMFLQLLNSFNNLFAVCDA